MLGPCCLCPLVDQNGPDFVEAAIYVVSTGALSGEYGCKVVHLKSVVNFGGRWNCLLQLAWVDPQCQPHKNGPYVVSMS